MSKATVLTVYESNKIPSAPVDGKVTIAYWNICGLGQGIRYAMEFAGVDYVDVRLHWGPGDPGTQEYKKMWFDKKPDMESAFAFPNLPYLFDGDVALTQTNAIIKYIGRKHGLNGNASQEHMVDMILDQVTDHDNLFTGTCYGKGLPGLKEVMEHISPLLGRWASLLGEKSFMTGDTVTVADCRVYELLRKIKLVEAEPEVGTHALDSFPTLLRYIERFENLPQMKAYMASAQYLPRPLNNEHAQYK